jgi:diaminopimelate epimerase
MTRVEFFKYHGLGNDFVLVDDLAGTHRLAWRDVAPQWCDRNRGVGADGVLVLESCDHANADVRTRIFNADGSEAQMCGNGVRCAAKYMVERRAWKATGARGDLRIEVGGRVRAVQCVVHSGEMVSASVDMGEPGLSPRDVPFVPGAMDETTRELTCVSIGNPHAVKFVEDVATVRLEPDGKAIERHPAFPEGVNVQFVQVISRSLARVRTWERGSGATQACGTGACAALVAGVRAGRLDRAATIQLPGGSLDVRQDERGHVMMIGPATEVYRGEIRW